MPGMREGGGVSEALRDVLAKAVRDSGLTDCHDGCPKEHFVQSADAFLATPAGRAIADVVEAAQRHLCPIYGCSFDAPLDALEDAAK